MDSDAQLCVREDSLILSCLVRTQRKYCIELSSHVGLKQMPVAHCKHCKRGAVLSIQLRAPLCETTRPLVQQFTELESNLLGHNNTIQWV